MAASSRKCKTLSLAERIDVITRLDNNESQASVAKAYGVHPSQISRTYKQREKLLDDWLSNGNPERKRKRTGKAEDVEEALLRWFAQARDRQLPLSGPLLMEKANQLARDLEMADFKATVGWLERWKGRNNIKFRKQHGERQDADDFAAERWLVDILPNILKEYEPRDVFNADETGLYWRAIPDGAPTFKQADVTGRKASKARVTLLLACNMDGTEKLEPLIIGQRKRPRCFKNVRRLPVAYESDKNAWVTGEIWMRWLKTLDVAMRSQKRQILMLCDNCSAHKDNVQLTNVRLLFLPPNTTSLIQPMGRGIIANFKRHYRALVLRHVMSPSDGEANTAERAVDPARKLTLMDSLHMQREAWSRVSQSTIADCYRKASFAKTSGTETTEADANIAEAPVDLPAGMTADEFAGYAGIDDDLQTAADATDLEIAADLQTAAADAGDSDGNPAGAAASPVTFAAALKSLNTVRAYLEANGCQSYERFYDLVNLVYDTNKQNAVQ